MSHWLKLALAAGILTLTSQMAAAQNATVEDIHVQLFYEHSGKLSDDLTKRKNLVLWNTMIGEGEAKEPANSFLIAVSVKGQPDTFDKAAALTVTVTSDDKRKSKVAEKAFGSGILFGPEGKGGKGDLRERPRLRAIAGHGQAEVRFVEDLQPAVQMRRLTEG